MVTRIYRLRQKQSVAEVRDIIVDNTVFNINVLGIKRSIKFLIVVIDLFGYLAAFLLSLTSVLKSDSKHTE